MMHKNFTTFMKHLCSISRTRSIRRAVAVVGLTAVLIGAGLPVIPRATASSPAGGTINPNSPPLTWNGSAPGGVVPNAPLGLIDGEELCQEGLNCDTFTLTIGGTAADWSTKLVRIKLEWLLPATD
ncbi:MAG TPA: hypothetical protein VFD48_06980, partial [Pyrinomonadaceae bacterium]|nr:hypothetical protein [Pyrinomonadaceae bacterium]